MRSLILTATSGDTGKAAMAGLRMFQGTSDHCSLSKHDVEATSGKLNGS